MRLKRHSAVEPLDALFRTFIQPHLSTTPRRAHLRHLNHSSQWRQLQLRPFSSTPATLFKPKKGVAKQEVKHIWNEQIKAETIKLVDPETNKLQPPIRLRDVLRTLDTATHRLVQVTPSEPNNPFFSPVCKLVTKQEEYETTRRRQAESKEARKARAIETSLKTLEINWAIDQNDLGHRLDRMEDFLREGRKVEVILAAKKKGRRASIDECNEVLKRIKTTADDITGAKEAKPMEGKVGGFAMLFFQGKADAQPKAVDNAT